MSQKVNRLSAFQVGLLVTGVGIGGPVATVYELTKGSPRALIFPVAAVLTLWIAYRTVGREQLVKMLKEPVLERGDFPMFAIGAAAGLLCLFVLFD